VSETSTRGDGPAMRSATDTFAPGRERGWNPTIPGRVWLNTRPPSKSSNQRRSVETPYQSLLRLLGELEYRRPGDRPLEFTPGEVDLLLASFTDESEAKLLEWCARYGLLGILLHRTVQLTLAPRTGVQIQVYENRRRLEHDGNPDYAPTPFLNA